MLDLKKGCCRDSTSRMVGGGSSHGAPLGGRLHSVSQSVTVAHRASDMPLKGQPHVVSSQEDTGQRLELNLFLLCALALNTMPMRGRSHTNRGPRQPAEQVMGGGHSWRME